MLRVFIDTTVFFAAVYSSTGSARDLIQLGTEGKAQIIISQRVMAEMERNLEKKAPHHLPDYQLLLAALAPEITDEPANLVEQVETYVVPKDAPIVASAMYAQVDFLVTYDYKHLLDHPEVSEKSGLNITTPDIVVTAIHDQQDSTEDQ
jgi:putative PIN family toxin of toxin-antitoxin system